MPTDRPGSFLVRLGAHDQSLVDLLDPTRIGFPYVRLLADVVDAHAEAGEPLRVVHVGGAGLTLPRYVATTRPRSPQIVLEPHHDLTEAVRRELPLPARSGIRVRPVDGATGLRQLPAERADLVVVDAFVDGVVPADLLTPDTLAAAARALGARGRLLLNLTDIAPFASVRDVLAALRPVLPDLLVVVETATWRGRRAGNLVVVAGRGAEAGAALAAVLAARSAGTAAYRLLHGPQVSDALGGGRRTGPTGPS